jgi:ring-1,2-phenylacetyl-CoA epoxidase subunit PaaC
MIEIKNTATSKFPHRGAGGFAYALHLADNALILGQRNSEWCAHGPVLEQDIAITNISLDLLGQARNFYQYAALLYNQFSDVEKASVDFLLPTLWRTYNRELEEDDLAFLREEHQYLNLLITELPKGDWAKTILRHFFFSAYQKFLYSELVNLAEEQLRAIAEKSLKEVNYHLRWSSEWVIRLGDGTEESNSRIKKALEELWSYTGEFFIPANYEMMDVSKLKNDWEVKVKNILEEATLSFPQSIETNKYKVGGKEGKHTEHFPSMLNEMQSLQRAYPNAKW